MTTSFRKGKLVVNYFDIVAVGNPVVLSRDEEILRLLVASGDRVWSIALHKDRPMIID